MLTNPSQFDNASEIATGGEGTFDDDFQVEAPNPGVVWSPCFGDLAATSRSLPGAGAGSGEVSCASGRNANRVNFLMIIQVNR